MSDTIQLPTSPVAGAKPGDVIAGRYRLERELGRGAMGTVWAAMHTTLGQRVAIKLIAEDKARSPEARQRFGVEAKAAARLRSRYVVQVYDDGEMPDGAPYIVMEYLEGQTLEQRLEAQRDIGLGEAVRITTHVGRALARAHAQGIVHRDLKSGNVFIARSEDDELGWVAKVLDFGVAKVLSESAGPSATRTGTIVGTPLFMSPEQIRGAAHVDHRADLYSLGMVFYNMVTGSHAFDGPSYSDVLVAICTQSLPDIRIAAPWLPPTLAIWFDKACAREREQRFQSADEMIEALQQASGPGARVTRPSVPEEISGPSGTLVGHLPPHAAATVLAHDFSPPSPSLASAPPTRADARGPATSRAEPSSSRETTLRSNPPGPPEAAPTRPRSSLWLWAASGVGLAVLTTAFAIVVTKATALLSEPRRTPEAVTKTPVQAVAATPAVTTPVQAVAATPEVVTSLPSAARVAAPSTSTATPETLPAPVTPPEQPASSAANTRPTPLAEVRAATPHRLSASPRRSDAVGIAAPKTPTSPSVAAATAAKAPATPAAPDMGF
jgi:serine/threonine-protein kinase